MLSASQLSAAHSYQDRVNQSAEHGQYQPSRVNRTLEGYHHGQAAPPIYTKHHRQHPYEKAPEDDGADMDRLNTSGPVRRRISRACDQCNQLRTKCDGQSPCAHCVEFSLGCEYNRARKKRGKASRKDLAQQAAAKGNAGKPRKGHEPGRRLTSVDRDASVDNDSSNLSSSDLNDNPGTNSRSLSLDVNGGVQTADVSNRTKPNRTQSLGVLPPMIHEDQREISSIPGQPSRRDDTHSPNRLSFGGYGDMNNYDRPLLGNPHIVNGRPTTYGGGIGISIPEYSDLPFSMQSPPTFHGASHSPGAPFRVGSNSMAGLSMQSPGQGNWMPLPLPVPQQTYNYQLRYPVLQPLVPHISGILPIPLACDLLDLYFASSSSAQMHPMSPYVLGYVFRKRSFLHSTKPRSCSPALLASMLWVAAQTSEASFLTTPPSARARTCEKLLELAVGLLKPLIHGPPVGETLPTFVNAASNGVALGGLGVAMPGTVTADAMSGESGAFGATGTLDDVATYFHLATVVSASEYKGASLRWWNAAWSLARELKLGRELPFSPGVREPNLDSDINNGHGVGAPAGTATSTISITEEEREERRRIWWLVYTVDRHLSLCYNKPLFLLDAECDGLLQPMDDTLWQAGEFFSGDSSIHTTSPNGSATIRRRGPNIECTGHSIFGYFTPLMTILGAIVDLNHARNHPRFGMSFRGGQEWDDYANEISLQLQAYENSLKAFEKKNLSSQSNQGLDDYGTEKGVAGVQHIATGGHAALHTSPANSVNTSASRLTTESDYQTRIVVAYGTHVMHVLHILLTGKWDPISLLDDNDLWISSQSFITATGHAVSAAEAIDNILEYDPGLEFMPFFFGIYLLQGSFLLLLIADKLQTEASSSVVKACETIVRAHEACVVTLNTEYQRNFRKVMRSALAQVKGRVPEDFREQQMKRREVLSLYRWVGNGTGLAL